LNTRFKKQRKALGGHLSQGSDNGFYVAATENPEGGPESRLWAAVAGRAQERERPGTSENMPPADVAPAGHDRCIINLKLEHIEAWLAPAGRSREELQSILSDRVVPAFEHEVQKAA
jgi:hypothetical protein